MKKLRRTLHRASSLFACLLAIRWGIWLLGQIPPVLALWQAFLNSALGRVAAYQFTAGALSVVLEADGAALCRDGSFLRLLPERQVVALDGVELEYIPFTRTTVLLTK